MLYVKKKTHPFDQDVSVSINNRKLFLTGSAFVFKEPQLQRQFGVDTVNTALSEEDYRHGCGLLKLTSRLLSLTIPLSKDNAGLCPSANSATTRTR